MSQKSPEHPTISHKQFRTTAADGENRIEKPPSKPKSGKEQLKDIKNSEHSSFVRTKSSEDSLPSTVSTETEDSVCTPQ